MKRKELQGEFETVAAKRQDRKIVIEKIINNPKVEADVWKNALQKKWGCEDLTYWTWTPLPLWRPANRLDKFSRAFALGNEEHIYALLFKNGLLRLYPPNGRTLETYVTTALFHPHTSGELWYSIFEIIWKYVPFETWFRLCCVSKSAARFFHGSGSPFYPLWEKCKKYITDYIPKKVRRSPWKCMNMFAQSFQRDFLIDNQKLTLKLLKMYLQSPGFKHPNFTLIEIVSKTLPKMEILFMETSGEQTIQTCVFVKKGLVSIENKRKCLIKLDKLAKYVTILVNSKR